MVPGCPPGRYPVEGSRCWGIEQVVVASSGSSDSRGSEVSVISASAPLPLALCSRCCDAPSVPWQFGSVAAGVGNAVVHGPGWLVGSDSWYDRWEKLPNSVRHALFRPGSSVARTTNHVVSRSALRPSSQLRLCYSYVHPRRWHGPFGPPWCIPVLSMGARGCCSSSVVRCSSSCLAACRVPYRAVSCG